MRNQKKNPGGGLLAVAALVLLAPVTLRFLGANSDFFALAGSRAAMVFAAFNMPDAGLEQLKERFRSELYGGASEPASESAHAAEPPVPPSQSDAPAAPAEASSGQEVSASIPVHDPFQSSVKPPKIPEKYSAELLSEDFSGRTNMTLVRSGLTRIRNDTDLEKSEILDILETGFDLGLEETGEPQLLLFHTHATESFERYDNTVYDTRNTWRSTDNNINMAAVGAVLLQTLEDAGVSALHDATQHDYPSYNGSYERSAETVQAYLDEHPSLKIILDLHRDAMPREDGVIVKPITVIDGKKAAQVMIIVGCDDGEMGMPNWYKNLRFAVALQNKAEELYPGLMRPIFLCYRKYNMHLSDGSLLLEFGSNANTLEEASYSARLMGDALAELVKEMQIKGEAVSE